MEPFLGQIQPFGFNFAPRGWATCSGQLLAIQQNSALFSLLGTTYGGNGTTTFALPDLRGRMPISQGQGPGLPPYVMGEMAGTTSVTLLTGNLPPHNHMMNVSNSGATTDQPTNALLAQAATPGLDPINVYGPPPPTATLAPTAISMTGSGIPVAIMPPFLTVNFCIATAGAFPSRN